MSLRVTYIGSCITYHYYSSAQLVFFAACTEIIFINDDSKWLFLLVARHVLVTVSCEFLQCIVLGKHGAVSDDVTLRGRDVIFFLKQAKIISRCRYVPGMPRPGVSK